jgi:hemin uptake protein HemP
MRLILMPFAIKPRGLSMTTPQIDPDRSPPESSPPADPVRPPPRNLTSLEILQGDTEVTISHNGEIYRLRVTRNGKLILQK